MCELWLRSRDKLQYLRSTVSYRVRFYVCVFNLRNLADKRCAEKCKNALCPNIKQISSAEFENKLLLTKNPNEIRKCHQYQTLRSTHVRYLQYNQRPVSLTPSLVHRTPMHSIQAQEHEDELTTEFSSCECAQFCINQMLQRQNISQCQFHPLMQKLTVTHQHRTSRNAFNARLAATAFALMHFCSLSFSVGSAPTW